ncbi:MAG: cytochrome c3 family protein [Chloroflexi bacterium]|nr:cytochrome c3 family protein [Chloroflexota bacterium]
MAQIFDRRANTLARLSIFAGIPLLIAILGGLWWLFGWSDWHRDVGVAIAQPGGGYNHQLHIGLRMDCRYCHTSVEVSSSANIPPTETCMGCHSQIISRSEKVAFIWQSWESGIPIQWNKVHDLPKFVYFNHSIHVAKGVGCSTCHGRIDQMRVVYKTQPLFMSWCLDCHRNPEKYVRPREEVFNMAWTPPPDQLAQGQRLVQEYNIRSSWELTNCAICHR